MMFKMYTILQSQNNNFLFSETYKLTMSGDTAPAAEMVADGEEAQETIDECKRLLLMNKMLNIRKMLKQVAVNVENPENMGVTGLLKRRLRLRARPGLLEESRNI